MNWKNNRITLFLGLIILVLLNYALLHNQTLGLPTDSDGFTILNRGVFANIVKIIVGLATSANLWLLVHKYLTPNNKIMTTLLTLVLIPFLFIAGAWLSYVAS